MTPPVTFLSFFIAAFLTFAMFSFLYRDNPVYKFAEHLFVGVAAGYYVVIAFKDSFMTHFVKHLQGEDPTRWIRLGAGVLGILILFHIVPRYSFLARWPIAFLVGAYAGLRLVGAMEAEVLGQVENLMTPVWRPGLPLFSLREESVVGNVLIVVGVVAVLLHFFFSRERGPLLRVASRIGVVYLMIAFGAAFGLTVIGRVSLLIGRARDLQRFGWVSLAAGAAVAFLLLWWLLWERKQRGTGERQ